MPGEKRSSQKSIQTTPKYPNDAEQSLWLTMAKQGYRDAFNKIVEKYQRPVYTLCYHMLNNATDAEDAAQEVFIRAYFKLDTYDETRKFSTWLFAIASHYCLDKLKMRRMWFVSWDDIPRRHIISLGVANQPEKAFIKEEIAAEVRQLLQTLHPKYRTAIILKYWYGMSYEEIAKTMNTTTGAIKSKLFRARKMIATRAAIVAPATTAQGAAQKHKLIGGKNEPKASTHHPFTDFTRNPSAWL